MPITRSELRESVSVRNTINAERVELGVFKSSFDFIDVRKITLPKKEDKGAALLVYEYKIEYNLSEPKNKSWGHTKIVGELVFADKASVVEELVSGWKKHKKMTTDLGRELLNFAFRDAQIEALEQSKKVGLPLPMTLPRLKSKSESPAS